MMNLKSKTIYLLLTSLFVSWVVAQEAPTRDVTKLSIGELQNYSEFRQHFSYEMGDFLRRYRAASAKDKVKMAASRPSVLPYHDLLAKCVREGSDKQADEIIGWWWHGGRGKRDAAVMTDLLIDSHIKSPIMEKYAPRIGWSLESSKAEAALKKLIEANEIGSVKAASMYSLTTVLAKKIETAEAETATRLKAEITSLESQLKTKYATMTDLTGVTYADRINGSEFAKQLAIGKPVPDIEGSDLKGVEFKLSDYKGKVTLISFWGHW